ncbi:MULTISPECIES: glutathione S-transferase N-terminal domain-containing protein [unclassified Xanthobacter]|uniref:glutathione S-transferase N-terminal domain-containing protein n=1 Tax=unclassified Xanthobacter TaxID=2623496 RepID=UPI001EDE5EBF|nr:MULTISPECIES: glutathione S-transferase N-terminal domain-containing protein [unclassified Xanthobacter]
MRLRYSLTSPFARKARLAAAVLGLPLELELADTLNPDDTLRRQNPLGKIPTLLTEDGDCLYDSRVILAYLDMVAGGGKLIPLEPKARIAAMKAEALADGLMDAGVLVLYEGRFRPEEKHDAKWLAHQRDKMARALEALEAAPPAADGPISAADITLACALGFLDFRFGGEWRAAHPRLVAWQTAFAARCPSFEETAPH